MRPLLRSVGAHGFAAALLLVSSSAFRQALSEFRDTEPGSLLFGVLQVVIGTSAVAGAVGLIRRARWAAPAVIVCGVAAVALLGVQPLFEPMEPDAQQSIALGAAIVGVAAAAVGWFAQRLHRDHVASRAPGPQDLVPSPAPVLLSDARPPAESFVVPAPDAHAGRDTRHHDTQPRVSDAPTLE
ncbi:MAG: hypothetical protein MUF00_10865 [Gemmatimonadaceae bacterium]|jgi:hypothetical protein|nr:hypothetical protein [Gemmatimonadaceae bacterium]